MEPKKVLKDILAEEVVAASVGVLRVYRLLAGSSGRTGRETGKYCCQNFKVSTVERSLVSVFKFLLEFYLYGPWIAGNCVFFIIILTRVQPHDIKWLNSISPPSPPTSGGYLKSSLCRKSILASKYAFMWNMIGWKSYPETFYECKCTGAQDLGGVLW